MKRKRKIRIADLVADTAATARMLALYGIMRSRCEAPEGKETKPLENDTVKKRMSLLKQYYHGK